MTAAKHLDDYIPQDVFKRVERMLYDYPFHAETVVFHNTDRGDVLGRYREWPLAEGDSGGQVSDRTGDSALRLDGLEDRRQQS